MNRQESAALDRWLTTEPEEGPMFWVGVAIAGYPIDVTELDPVPLEDLVAAVGELCERIAEDEWQNAHALAAGNDFEAAWMANLSSDRFQGMAATLDPNRVTAPKYVALGDAGPDTLFAEQVDYVLRVVAGTPYSRTSSDLDSYTRVLVVEEVER